MPDEQDSGPEHVEAVPSSHPLNGPDQVVRRLRAGVRDPVIEIGQDRPLPVLEGCQERAKSRPDLRIESGVPFLVSFLGIGSGEGLVDVVEPLLRLVNLDQDREVLAPFLQAFYLDPVQVREPLQEDMPIPHEGAPFLGMERSPYGLSEGIQGGVGHLQDRKLVHDDGNPGQGFPDGLLIRTPHVEDHAPDPPLVRKIREIAGRGRLVPVGKHLDYEAGWDVREDSTGPADQMHLVDPQDLRGLEAEGILEILGVVIEDLPDGEGPDSRLFRQLPEGVAEGFFFKPRLEPGRHEPLVVYGGKWLIEGPFAGLAPEAPGIDGDPDPFFVDGEVPDPLLPASEADQGARPTMDASVRRRDCFRFDLVIPVGILDLEDAVGRKVQDVRFPPLVLCKSDLVPFLCRWFHQLPDRLEQPDNGLIVNPKFSFKFLDLSG